MIRQSKLSLPTVLFWLTLLAAGTLFALVATAPLLIAADADASGWQRLLFLFGHDVVVRRTACASAVGLTVTAFVFFRPLPMPRDARPSRPNRGNVVGA